MSNATTKAGMTGGMTLTLLSTLGSGDITKTIALSALGAAVSFIVTMLCKKIFRN